MFVWDCSGGDGSIHQEDVLPSAVVTQCLLGADTRITGAKPADSVRAPTSPPASFARSVHTDSRAYLDKGERTLVKPSFTITYNDPMESHNAAPSGRRMRARSNFLFAARNLAGGKKGVASWRT